MYSRLALVAALSLTVAAANAYQFTILSAGTQDYSDLTGVANENVIGSFGTPSSFNTLTLDFATLTGEYAGPDGNLDFTFTWSPSSPGYPFNDGEYYNGVWTYSNTSTGDYANMTGGGTFAFGINNQSGNTFDSTTTTVGNLAATPEPASMAALAIGAVALIRRRKRA